MMVASSGLLLRKSNIHLQSLVLKQEGTVPCESEDVANNIS